MHTPILKLSSAVALAVGVQIFAITAHAAVPNIGDILTIDNGVPAFDTYGNPAGITGGSWFGMDSNGDSKIALAEQTAINAAGTDGGIVIGTTQTASGSHAGPIDGSESPAFDIWEYFGNTGMDYTRVAPVGLSTNTLDFSGWTVTWNSNEPTFTSVIDMGTGAWDPGNCGAAHMGCTGLTFANGVANFSWDGNYGSTYTLWYTATVPLGDPSNFGGVQYIVKLTGTVIQPGSNVPPTAAPVSIANLSPGGTANWTPSVSDPDVGDTLTCSIEPGDEPNHGGASVASDCSTGTYTHADDGSTSDSFIYTVSDGTETRTATVSVTISSGNGGSGGGSTPGTLPNGIVLLGLEPGVQQLNPDGSKLNVTVGSWFGMDTGGDSRMAGNEKTALQPGPDGGLIMRSLQAATGSHSGPPNGSENASVDVPWSFFGNTGLHFTSINPPVAIGGNTGNGIDMSGWRVTWNGISAINMGTGAWNPGNCDALNITTCSFANGVAQFSWVDEDLSGGISDGDTYRLIYAATVPLGDPSGFGGVRYMLNLTGTITVIPPPTTTIGTLTNGILGGTAENGYRATSALPVDSGYTNVGGYFDYKVNCGGAGIGCTSPVTISLTAPIPTGAVLRKHGVTPGNPLGGWSSFDTTGGDSIESADRASGGGDCAAATYSAGLTAGHTCLRITQTDGGLNDTDPTAGIIGDPSGIAVPAAVAAEPNLSSGSSGCTLTNRPVSITKSGDWLLVGLALAGLAWFRRRAL